MSQTKEILKHLEAGNSLTPLEALEKFDCFRLGARCYDLRKEGYNIQSEIVKNPWNGKRYAKYFLKAA